MGTLIIKGEKMNNCIYVAELGINHNGNIYTALQMIDLAKRHNFDYVKFQKRDIDMCYTKEYLSSPRESPWGKTQRDQKQGLELSINDYRIIDNYCKQIGIKWFYSPWDINSAVLMSQFDCDFIKIAKATLNHKELANFYRNTQDKLIISTNLDDYENEAGIIYNYSIDNIEYILSCISLYPSPINYNGLENISYISKRYGKKAGYSNHSPSWVHPVIASYLGAKMIEVHITLDKNGYGSDQKASLDDNDLANIMKYKYRELDEAELNEYLTKENEVLNKLRQTW